MQGAGVGGGEGIAAANRGNGAASPAATESQRVPMKIALRSESGVRQYTFSPSALMDDEPQIPNGSLMQYSEDGRYLAVARGKQLFIFLNGKLEQTLEHEEDVGAVAFSPKASFVVTWTRFGQPTVPSPSGQAESEEVSPPAGQPKGNLKIWSTATGGEVHSFVQKKITSETWPPFRWTADELISAKMVSSEIQFFTGQKWDEVVRRIKLAGVTNFSLAPGPAPPAIAAFVPEKKGGPGAVRVYRYPKLGDVIASKTVWKAQTSEFFWNQPGTGLLVATHTDVDRTGKSYYGQTSLYFLSIDGSIDCNVPLDAEGPVHHCSWSPDGSQFLVIYGFMPAKATLFDSACNKLADFGRAARNTAKWSPCGRMLCIAGFGNLNGQVDVWDIRHVKKIGSCVASCASSLDWSPDSACLLTAVLSPKIRVDNGITIFRHDGSQMFKQSVEQLYQAVWRPALPGTHHPARIKSGKAAPASSTPGAEASAVPGKPALYVPPSRRGGPAILAREEEAEVQPRKYTPNSAAKSSTPVGWTESKTAKRNKQRRQRKKKEKVVDTTQSDNADAPTPTEAPTEAPTTSPPQDAGKRRKALEKKLRQIGQLREKQQAGQQLNELQLQKLQGEQELRKELETLPHT